MSFFISLCNGNLYGNIWSGFTQSIISEWSIRETDVDVDDEEDDDEVVEPDGDVTMDDGDTEVVDVVDEKFELLSVKFRFVFVTGSIFIIGIVLLIFVFF